METIQNAKYIVKTNHLGAEIVSIIRKSDNREYIWQAAPEYWAGQSPLLFPIVGTLWNDTYRLKGKEYTLPRHGFARRKAFELVEKKENLLRYRLTDNNDTIAVFPYHFILEVAYTLTDKGLNVLWYVKNTSNETMHFQIGGHPAFNYANYDANAETQGYLKLDYNQQKQENDQLRCSIIGQKGCIGEERKLENVNPEGLIPIKNNTFADDAIILEQGFVNAISLLNRAQEPYLRVEFSAPLVGIWSPRQDEFAPFVCIEPWYGRCDKENFEGEFADKDWMQHLESGKEFERSYDIIIL